MISIRDYMFPAARKETGETLLRVVRLLLQGIGLHAVEGDKADYERFRADMERLGDSVSEDAPSKEWLVVAGAAQKAMEDYNQCTTRFLKSQGAEMQTMVSMLTNTLVFINSAGDESARRLQDIEKQLEKASVIEDVRMLKMRMADCLEGVRAEAKRQKTEAANTVQGLRREMEESQERLRAPTAGSLLDRVTALHGRPDAEALLGELARSGRQCYAVVMLIDRLQLINQRYGYAIGDVILRTFKEQVLRQFSAADKVFRWTGPAFLAVLERTETIEMVRLEVSRTASTRIEKTVQIGARTVLLPISAAWAVFPVNQGAEILIEKIDRFAAGQAQKEGNSS